MSILIITTHHQGEWDGGDSIITLGLMNLLPRLRESELIFSADVNESETYDAVSECEYIIHAGTPSWHRTANRRFWHAAIRAGRRIAMLGIGLAVPYSGIMWYGAEEFIELKDSGLIDLIVCRDKYCHYWIQQKLGFDGSKITTLPCPGFYALPMKPVQSKSRVVLSIADIERTSKASEYTFRDYYPKTRHLIEELRGCGAEVSILYQRRIKPPFADVLAREFPGETIHSQSSPDDFAAFMADKDVYIGVRNHGALSCAGSGMPSLLLGTDDRQAIADEIPFISKIDISHAAWEVREVSDWYRSVDSASVQLLAFRQLTESRWHGAISPLIESLS